MGFFTKKVSLTDEQERRFKALSKHYKLSIDDMINDAINRYLNKEMQVLSSKIRPPAPPPSLPRTKVVWDNDQLAKAKRANK